MVNKDELKGKVTELKGKITGDESEELKGKITQEVGKVKEKVDKLVDDASGKVNEFLNKKDKE